MNFAGSKTVTTADKTFPNATKIFEAAVPSLPERVPCPMANAISMSTKTADRDALRRELLKRILHNEATRRKQRAAPAK
jgi:hypothetical protein